MFRIAAAAFLLTVSAASADHLVGFAHNHVHGVQGSFSNPINYRPNRAPGFSAVRTRGYSEANTKTIRNGRPGVTTSTSVAPPHGVTGTYLAPGLQLLQDQY